MTLEGDWPPDEDRDDLERGYASARSESSAGDLILYVPDFAELTGWSTYLVRRTDRSQRGRQAIGFGRR